MSNSFTQGAGYVLTGLRWLPKAGLRGFVAMPLLINSVLFGGGIWLGASQLERLDRAVQGWLPEWLAWLHWLLWLLFVLTVLVVVFYTFSLVANLLAAPFNGLLAERVEKMVHPDGRVQPPPAESSWRELLFSPLAELAQVVVFRRLGHSAGGVIVRAGGQRSRASAVGGFHVLDAGAGVRRLSARQPRVGPPGAAPAAAPALAARAGFRQHDPAAHPDPGTEFPGHAGGGDRRDADVESGMVRFAMNGDTDWRVQILRGLYTGLLYLALPLALLRLYWRGRRDPGYRQRWRERLGLIPPLPSACLWIHAVSVGETRAALPLIRALLARYPDRPLLVTTTTLTGSRQVREALGEWVHHVYAPYDLPGAVRRFLRNTQPRLAIIMETELWPNLLRQGAVAGIPVLIANARLSERSARGYARIRRLTASMLRDVTLIAAQAESDAGRFRALGAPRLQVTGNLKYDLALPDDLVARGLELRRELLGENRSVWIAASTHAGEDEQILDAFARLRDRWPELLLLLVPRHPERFDGVAALCRQRGFPVVRRSEQRPCAADTAIFFGDSMGELLLFYAAADLAFVGGSLVATGGHNVLEPALLSLPVLFGPHMFNFTEAGERLLEVEAAWQVTDAVGLAATVDRLLADPALRQAAGQRGQAVVERHRGALAALLTRIEALLGRGP